MAGRLDGAVEDAREVRLGFGRKYAELEELGATEAPGEAMRSLMTGDTTPSELCDDAPDPKGVGESGPGDSVFFQLVKSLARLPICEF